MHVYPRGTNLGSETRGCAAQSLLSRVGEAWQTHAGGGLAATVTDDRGAQDPASPRWRATPDVAVWSRGVRDRPGAGAGLGGVSPEHPEEPSACSGGRSSVMRIAAASAVHIGDSAHFWLGGS